MILALNQLGQLSEWHEDILREEIDFLLELDFDMQPIGFDTSDIDLWLGTKADGAEPDVELPSPDEPALSVRCSPCGGEIGRCLAAPCRKPPA